MWLTGSPTTSASRSAAAVRRLTGDVGRDVDARLLELERGLIDRDASTRLAEVDRDESAIEVTAP